MNRTLGVLISGRGSNLQALIDAIADGALDARIAVVISNRADAAGLTRAREAGIDYSLNPGEGAFYGPKLEFVLRDAIGRDWQCGTLQVDLNLPGRLGAHYIDEHSQRQTPVMLHRAIFGSLERFLGILIEHHAGKLPTWLAPTQVVLMNITDQIGRAHV